MANQTYTFETLTTFDDAAGSEPISSLIMDSVGNLYGTTSQGTDNAGTVFEIAKGDNSVTTLATFNVNGSNGAGPIGTVIMDSAGNLFGTTQEGGVDNKGTAFEIVNGSHSVTTLATFDGTNGTDPAGSLIMDSSGDLYGVTNVGGANNVGTVFEIVAGSHSVATLATFDSTNGSLPNGSLIMDSQGNLYGTTEFGGATNNGTVFEIASGSTHVTTLASFDGTDGAVPRSALIMDSAGNLFGTTVAGTDNRVGTVFEIVKDSGGITTLATFDSTNGASSYASLIADSAGNLFGTTSAGGADNQGTVFEIVNGSNSVTTLATFDGNNGASPHTSLIADSAGNLFGTTNGGNGTVFELVAQTPPTIASESASPTSADLNSGTVTFTVATSEAVNAAGSSLTLNNGATAAYASGDGLTAPLTYAYTVSPGHDTTDLQATALSGTITDSTGTALDTTKFTTIDTKDVIDTTSPTIVSEAANPTSANLDAGTVTFTLATSEAVSAAGSSLTLNNGATATYASGDGLTTPLTYAYTVASGQDTTDLQATALNGTITDAASNILDTTTFTAIDAMDVIDTILPATPVAVDPTTSGFVNRRTPVMTGTVADASGGTSVELFEGDPSNGGQDLGAATVNGDGTWTFTQNIGAGDFNALTAVVTDASGTTTVASAPYELVTGITGEPYRAVEYDAASDGSYSYTQYGRNGALLVAAYDNGDNTHTIEGNGDAGNQLNSVGNDVMTGGGANTTFVFFPASSKTKSPTSPLAAKVTTRSMCRTRITRP